MTTESEVRRLRDIVYGHPTTDANWNGCKENWMKPESVAWLKEQTKESIKPIDNRGSGEVVK